MLSIFLVCLIGVLMWVVTTLVGENVELTKKLKATENANRRIFLKLKGLDTHVIEDLVMENLLRQIVSKREANNTLAEKLEPGFYRDEMILAHNQLSSKMEKDFIKYLMDHPN